MSPAMSESRTWIQVYVISLNYTRNYWSSTDWNFNASVFLPFEELRELYVPENNLAGWVENDGRSVA